PTPQRRQPYQASITPTAIVDGDRRRSKDRLSAFSTAQVVERLSSRRGRAHRSAAMRTSQLTSFNRFDKSSSTAGRLRRRQRAAFEGHTSPHPSQSPVVQEDRS